MGRPTGCTNFTDYSTPCGELPQSFFQMLANCIVEYDGHCMLNAIYCFDSCDDLTPCITCDEQSIDPERLLVNKLFALDECGNLALKLFINIGEEDGQ
jgi:hypothetical protein